MDDRVTKYLKEKYGENFEKDAESKYKDTTSRNHVTQAFANLGDVLAGKSVGSADDYFSGLNKQAKENTLGRIEADRKSFHENAKNKREADLSDPMSQASIAFRKGLAANFPRIAETYGADFENVSAADQESIFKPLQLREQIEARKEAARIAAGQQNQARQDRADLKAEAIERQKQENIEKDVQKFSDSIGNSQDIGNALAGVESNLGFNIDDAVIGKGGKLLVGGKEKDLPGVSIPLLGRTSFYSDDARVLESAMAKVFNTELKDRSGAAVTTPELERLKTEFATGKFNTEPEMIRALSAYKKAAATALQNREAAFRPEVVDRYKSRGGYTSENLTRNSGKQIVKTQTNPKTNQKRVVYSDGSTEIINMVAGGK